MPKFAVAAVRSEPVQPVGTDRYPSGVSVSQVPTFYVEASSPAEARKAANRVLAQPSYTGTTYELSIEEV